MQIEATVTFLEAARHLMPSGPWTGMQPSFAFAGNLVACRVEAIDGSERMPFSVPVRVRIQTIVVLDPFRQIRRGSKFGLNLADQELAEGIVERVSIPGEGDFE